MCSGIALQRGLHCLSCLHKVVAALFKCLLRVPSTSRSLSNGKPNLILDDPLLSQLLSRMGTGSGTIGVPDALGSNPRCAQRAQHSMGSAICPVVQCLPGQRWRKEGPGCRRANAREKTICLPSVCLLQWWRWRPGLPAALRLGQDPYAHRALQRQRLIQSLRSAGRGCQGLLHKFQGEELGCTFTACCLRLRLLLLLLLLLGWDTRCMLAACGPALSQPQLSWPPTAGPGVCAPNRRGLLRPRLLCPVSVPYTGEIARRCLLPRAT